MNHTLGPWNMVGLNDDRIAIVAHDATDVATLTHANHADARLIAAAPELLARLQECIKQMETMDARLLRLTGSPYECELGEITRARAAINKAIGE